MNLGNKQWLNSDKFFTCPTAFEIWSGPDEVNGVYVTGITRKVSTPQVYGKAVVYRKLYDEPNDTPLLVYKTDDGWIFSDELGSQVSKVQIISDCTV